MIGIDFIKCFEFSSASSAIYNFYYMELSIVVNDDSPKDRFSNRIFIILFYEEQNTISCAEVYSAQLIERSIYLH